MDSGTLLSLVLGAIVAVGTILLVYFAWRAHRRAQNKPEQEEGAKKVTNVPQVSLVQTPRAKNKRTESLYDGEVHVGSGEHEAVPLHLAAGDLVQGVVKARYGRDLNVYLMDEANYGKFLNGRRFRKIWTGEGVSASTVDVEIPEPGLWYLVLDLYGKQLDRDVTVRLRRIGE